MEAWAQREAVKAGVDAGVDPGVQSAPLAAEQPAERLRAETPPSGLPRVPLFGGQLLSQAQRVVVVAHTTELRLTVRGRG